MTIIQPPKPYDLVQRVQQQNPHLDLFDPEYVMEDHFIAAAQELLSLTDTLYLTSRPCDFCEFEIHDKIYLLTTEKPSLTEMGIDDWEENKNIALLRTSISYDLGDMHTRIIPRTIIPEIIPEHNAKIYLLNYD